MLPHQLYSRSAQRAAHACFSGTRSGCSWQEINIPCFRTDSKGTECQDVLVESGSAAGRVAMSHACSVNSSIRAGMIALMSVHIRAGMIALMSVHIRAGMITLMCAYNVRA